MNIATQDTPSICRNTKGGDAYFYGVKVSVHFKEGVTKSPVTISSLLRHPTIYGLACLFFVSVGVSFIPNSIKSPLAFLLFFVYSYDSCGIINKKGEIYGK